MEVVAGPHSTSPHPGLAPVGSTVRTTPVDDGPHIEFSETSEISILGTIITVVEAAEEPPAIIPPTAG
jgi:hypothetical protein